MDTKRSITEMAVFSAIVLLLFGATAGALYWDLRHETISALPAELVVIICLLMIAYVLFGD